MFCIKCNKPVSVIDQWGNLGCDCFWELGGWLGNEEVLYDEPVNWAWIRNRYRQQAKRAGVGRTVT